MGTSEEYCLRWNDFQENISSTWGELLNCTELQDVTLQCGLQSLQCHRFVLAACSDWFRTIFKNLTVTTSNTRHPVIVMWDTEARDMKLLLEFMYNGVVNVKQDNLDKFLALAERLNVRGLTHGKETATNINKSQAVKSQTLFSQYEEPSERSQDLTIVKQEQEDIHINNEDIETHSDFAVEENQHVHVQPTISSHSDISIGTAEYGYTSRPKHEPGFCVLCERNYGNMAIHFEDYHPNNCPYCLVEIKIKRNLHRHIEDKHEPTSNPCDICGKVYSSSNKLNSHKSSYHKDRVGASKFTSNVANFF